MAEGHELDRRLNPYRKDLAAASLRGQVEAEKFVEGTDVSVTSAFSNLCHTPEKDAPLDSQLLHGEIFRVYDVKNGWAWGQAQYDDYVGYVPQENLGAVKPTDKQITALRSFVYREPDIKSPVLTMLTIGARVKQMETQGRFVRLAHGGWVVAAHLGAQNERAEDFVTVAEEFVGTPYLWGGRTSLGLDCSALVQLALMQAGFACPRDTDMQESVLGQPASQAKSGDGLQRGDLVFWKGHVGILCDEKTLLHANASHMKTVREDFASASARIAASDGPVTSIRRMSGLSA